MYHIMYPQVFVSMNTIGTDPPNKLLHQKQLSIINSRIHKPELYGQYDGITFKDRLELWTCTKICSLKNIYQL